MGIDSAANIIYTFTYNNDGTVATISTGSGSNTMVKTFRYNANNIVISLLDGSFVYSKDSLLLDAQSRIIRADHWGDNEAPYPNIVYEQYQYDSLGNLVTSTSHQYNSINTTIYQWKSGDVTWNTAGTDFYDYVYGTALYNTGNIKAFLTDFENYGRAIYTPTHLATMAIMDNTDTFLYNYALDSGGRVSQLKITEPGNYTHTTLVSYDCE